MKFEAGDIVYLVSGYSPRFVVERIDAHYIDPRRDLILAYEQGNEMNRGWYQATQMELAVIADIRSEVLARRRQREAGDVKDELQRR